MRTPEQLAYEKAQTEAVALGISLDSKLIAAEKNIQTLRDSFSSAVFSHESEKTAPNPWGSK